MDEQKFYEHCMEYFADEEQATYSFLIIALREKEGDIASLVNVIDPAIPDHVFVKDKAKLPLSKQAIMTMTRLISELIDKVIAITFVKNRIEEAITTEPTTTIELTTTEPRRLH